MVFAGLPCRSIGNDALYESHALPQRKACLVPVYPRWPGFAINTIFYAAILWVMFFVPGMLKRTLRRRRGQCPACAYPVGTSNVCTECGTVVSRQQPQTKDNHQGNMSIC